MSELSQPMRCFLTEDVPAAFIYFIVFPREDAGFATGMCWGMLGLWSSPVYLPACASLVLWQQAEFWMELQCVQLIKYFRTFNFKKNSRKWLVVAVAGCAHDALVKMVKPASVIMYCIFLVNRSP